MTDEKTDWADLMTPGEVADLFRVSSKTVTRWAKKGRLKAVTTPGGHKRFRRSHIEKMLKEETEEL